MGGETSAQYWNLAPHECVLERRACFIHTLAFPLCHPQGKIDPVDNKNSHP